MDDVAVAELIHRRRRQILIHSVLYYRMDVNLIPDAVYDAWSQELVKLQTDYPKISQKVKYLRKTFKDFEGFTGFDLPLLDARANFVAKELIAYSERPLDNKAV